MLKVRKKTFLDSVNQAILRMIDAGIPLSWDRYEEQLPLCGFTQNGLNCSACLQGPCRISPFQDKPDHGICGADGRQIVLHNLVEKVRRGALDHINVCLDAAGEDGIREKVFNSQSTADLVSRLPESVTQQLKAKGLLPSSLLVDAVTARDPFFVDPGMLDDTLKSILRLGMCSIVSSMALCQINGEGAQPGDAAPPSTSFLVNILVDGAIPRGFLQNLKKATHEQKDVRLVGTAGNGCLHIPGSRSVSSGSPELAVAAGLVDFVIQSDLDGYPSLFGMCDQLRIPRLTVSLSGPWPDVADILAKAREHTKLRMKPHDGECGVLTEARPADIGKVVRDAVQSGTARGVVLLIGGTNVRQTYFERTAKIMKGLLSNDVVLLVAAEAAGAVALFDGLEEAAGSGIKKVMQGRARPWFSVGSLYESARALEVFGPLAGANGFSEAPAAAAFLEIPTFAYLSSAFGWLAMGLTTQIGAPLPIWGNGELTKWMTDEAESRWGARLLASPKLATPEEQVQQIMDQLSGKG